MGRRWSHRQSPDREAWAGPPNSGDSPRAATERVTHARPLPTGRWQPRSEAGNWLQGRSQPTPWSWVE